MTIVPSAAPDIATRNEFRIERTVQRADTSYELFVGPCSCCDRLVYRLMRTCGASTLSVYQISARDAENLDEYVDQVHVSFAVDVHTKVSQIHDAIKDLNSGGLLEAEDVAAFKVRLIDRSRLLWNRLSRNGVLDQILQNADDIENDLSAAFLLGSLATEFSWLETHEDAVFEGWAHMEGREAGRPLAIAARLRLGKRSRRAVVEAAKKLYEQDPTLRRNDSRTASKISEMKLDSLRKRDGTFLGVEAIVKHLRASRRHKADFENS